MSWYLLWSDSIKKRACRYILQHYLGQFLKEKLSLDQLTVDLYSGRGDVNNVLLDVVSLNETLETYNVPFEIIDGYIGNISVTIPWSGLLSDNTLLTVNNLELTIQPKQRKQHEGTLPIDSMLFSGMTTSLQLAEEFLKQEPTEGEQKADLAQPFEGLEIFAQTIDAVLSKVKVCLVDSVIRIEHVDKVGGHGAALEIKISRLEYFDDLASQAESASASESGSSEFSSIPSVAVAVKNFQLMGVKIYCDDVQPNHVLDLGLSTVQKTDRDVCDSQESHRHQSIVEGDRCADEKPVQTKSDLDPIPIMVLGGKQQLKLKLKQNEEMPGAKIELDCQFGSLNVFLTPHLVHLLYDIIEAVTVPDSSADIRGGRRDNDIMYDLTMMDNELPHASRASDNGWRYSSEEYNRTGEPCSMTSQSLDDSDDDGYQFSCKVRESVQPVCSESPAAGNAYDVKGMNRLVNQQTSVSSELSRIKLRVSMASVVIAHEDPSTISTDENGSVTLGSRTTALHKLKEMSENFFQSVLSINASGIVSPSEMVKLRAEYSRICQYDHLGLLCKPLSLEINNSTTNSISTLSAHVSLGLTDLVEAVFERNGNTSSLMGFHLPIKNVLPDYCELLTFCCGDDEIATAQSLYTSMHSVMPSCVRIDYKTTTNISKIIDKRQAESSGTTLSVHLASCKCELDITIVDRIHALLKPAPWKHSVNSYAAASSGRGNCNMSLYVDANQSFHSSASQVNQSIFAQAVSDDIKPSSLPIDVSIASSCLTLDIRFPVVDLRTGQELERAWWKRNLSHEILTLELKDALIETSLRSSAELQQFSLTCHSGRGLFLYDMGQEPIPFIRFSESSSVSLEDGSDLPRLRVKIFPKKEMIWEEHVDDSCFQSVNYMSGLCELSKSSPGPFSARKVMYESEKSSEKRGENEDFQELKMPGDRKEMSQFEESSRNNTLLLFDINLPDVAVFIPDKSFCELLYNRLLNDLVLWEPAAPAQFSPTSFRHGNPSQDFSLNSGDVWSPDLVTRLTHKFSQPGDVYSFCKSNYSHGSESDTDDDYMNESMTCGHGGRQEQTRSIFQKQQQQQQSKMCVELHIAQGFLSAALPLNEESDTVPFERGEFVITLDNLKLFVSCGHNGDPEIHQMSLRSNNATLYHSGLVVGCRTVRCVDEAVAKGYDHLCKTIYPTEVKSGKASIRLNEVPMLSLALQINSDSFRNMKSYLLSLSLHSATLRYRMAETGRNWFSQIMDMIDLTDYPIQGYTIPTVVTELYTHLVSCVIDYRPLYLPLRAVLTVEAFSISSNIIVDSAVSVLRFVADDAALFLSNHLSIDEEGILSKDYICIVNMGMFELTIRTSNSSCSKHPKFEMKASNDMLHIHTCADSFSSLATLIQYLAGEEDMVASDARSTLVGVTQKSNSDIERGAEHIVNDGDDDVDEMLESGDDVLLNDLMADAMQESCAKNQSSTLSTSQDNISSNESKVEAALGRSVESDIGCPVYQAQAANVCNDVAGSSHSLQLSSSSSEMADYLNSDHRMDKTFAADDDDDDDDDDDVDEDDDDDFCMVDEPGLRYAKHNGEPIIRCYTDESITIISNHFSKPVGKIDLLKSPDHFPPAEYRYTLKEMTVIWSMYGGSDFQAAPATDIEKRSGGYKAGGPHRDFNTVIEVILNKVRLQHEVFGMDEVEASRQVLLINEIEIKDKLSSSNINKLLYLYSSESLPRQSQANMLMIKALHNRSEPNSVQQECSVKIALQPLRLNIDQDALFFLRKYFTDLTADERPELVTDGDLPETVTVDICSQASAARARKQSEHPAASASAAATQATLSSSPRRCDKVMTLSGTDEQTEGSIDPADQQQMLMQFSDVENRDVSSVSNSEDSLNTNNPSQRVHATAALNTQESSGPVFFKSVLFSPEVPIRLDYQGKWLDMEQGTIIGVLIGLAQLNCSELRLKRVHHRHGILGIDRLLTFLANEWLQDIKKTQIPSLLGGVGPLYSLVQLVQGCKDLVWLPVEQYRKDGRIIRGIQRGTHSFITCTAMSTLELTNRLVQSVQIAAEMAFDVVSPGPGVRTRKKQARKQLSHPTDLRAGVTNAYTIVTEGLYDAASDMYRVAVEEHDNKGTVGAVGGILRHMPSAVIEPVIIASEATSNVLGGMRNQLLPDRRKEDEEKWKTM